jgi:hypothetical protein
MVRLRMKCDKNDVELPHLRDFLALFLGGALRLLCLRVTTRPVSGLVSFLVYFPLP